MSEIGLSHMFEDMELNTTFMSGVACGACLGLSLFALRRLSRFSPRSVKPPGPGEGDLTADKPPSIMKAIKKAINEGGEYKVVLVVRNDLKMGKGKIGAQCAHAAVGVYSKAFKKDKTVLQIWEYTGQAKIALKVESEAEMMEIYDNAKKAGLITSLIHDAGRTQIAPNTKTVLGIGPGSKVAIDKVTGHLKLLS